MMGAEPRRERKAPIWMQGLGLTLALLFLAAACGSSTKTQAASPTTNDSRPVDGGSLVIGTPTDPSGWNPHTAEWDQSASLIGSSVLEPLAALGSDNSAKPWLATSWIADTTFTQWEIKLRPGVQFQDGEPFDATAVKENIDDAVSGVISGQAYAPLIQSTSVIDDHTVLVKMTEPWAAFPSSFLDGQAAMMMAPAMLKAADHGASHPIGTGPFTFESWQPGNEFQTKRNPDYWQKGLPHLNSLDFRTISDSGTQADSLQAGDVDMILTASANNANRLGSSFHVIRDWDTEPVNLVLNTVSSFNGTTNPFANQDARLAIAYATDRQQVADSIGTGVLSPTSPFAPSTPWGMPDAKNKYPAYDLTKAKQEVAAYEHATGQKSLTFSVLGEADVDTTRLLQMLQAQWLKAGINAKITASAESALATNLVTGNYNAALVQLYSAPDPDSDAYFWSAATIKGVGAININMAQYTTPQIETDLKTGRQSGYESQRKSAYDDLVVQLNAASTNIWLYWTPYSLIANKKVQGLEKAGQVPFGNFSPKTWLGSLWVQ
jgi:peptide/nickel transport system substrate-binding protein